MFSKLAFAIAFVVASALPAFAQTGTQKSSTVLNAEVNQLWPDQNAGALTPFGARQTLLDIIASYPNLNTGPGVTNSQLANMAGSSDKCNPTASPAAPQDCVISSVNKIVYVSTAGNDSNDGLSWQSAKLTLQAAENAANPNGIVFAGSGTFTLGSALSPQPGVRLTCAPGTIITQGNAANLNPLIDFTTNTANAASIDRCTIDGNRANNTDAAGSGLINLIKVGTVNDVLLDTNIIKNSNGTLVAITSGLRPIIRFNKFANFFDIGVSIITGVVQNATNARILDNDFTSPMGFHPIYMVQSDRNTVCRNYIDAGTIVGAPGSTTHINTSGTAVTFQSGQNFANAFAGQILVTNAGQEFLVTQVNSNTSLTLATSAGTLNNVLAAIGTGDLISINNSAFAEICDNVLFGGVSDGIVPNNFVLPNGETTQKINIHGNNIANCGEYCIFIASTAGSSQVNDIKVFGNLLVDAGLVAAAGPSPLTAIGVQGSSINNVSVDANTIRDDQITPTIANWMLAASNAGTITVGSGNSYSGTTNAGISGAVSSISLSAGWGTTATTDQIQSEGNAVFFRVNSSGTGQGANPTVTVNTIATKAASPKLTQCKMVGGSGAITTLFAESGSTTTAISFTFVGTPTAGLNYQITCL